MRKIIALLLMVCLVLSLSACGFLREPAEDTSDGIEETFEASDDESAETDDDSNNIPKIVKLNKANGLEGRQIGFTISKVESDEWCQQLVKAVEVLGAYYGADVNCLDAEENIEDQIIQIENFTADEYDMIFIDPISADGPAQAITEAQEEGVPVICCYDECSADVETFVTWDAYEGGKVFAQYFIDYVKEHNANDTVRIIELTNSASERAKERYKALHEACDASGINFEIIGTYETEGNREYAYAEIEKLKDTGDYIISDVDNGAFGASAALIAAGNTTTKIFSMSAYGIEPFTALYVEDENYTACLNVDPWVLAQAMYDSTFNYFANQENEKVTNIDSYMVDSSNVTDFWSFEEE